MIARRTRRPAAARLLVVATTVATRAQARALGQAMVQQRLAACAHVLGVQSVYRWQGRLRRHTEYRLELKTTARHAVALERAVRSQHPYELPDVHAVALERVYEPYARWVADSCDRD